MTLDRDLRIRTAEHVGISYDVAGIGNRVLAAFLDVLFLLIIVLGLSFIVIRAILPQLLLPQSTDFTIAAVLIVVLYLLTPFAYWVVLETFWNGQTLGKRIVGIRVLRDDGSPVGFFAIATRALLRILDLVPVLLPVDLVLMVVSRKAQRLVREFALRERTLKPAARAEVARAIARSVRPAIPESSSVPDDVEFLRAV